MNLLVRFAFCKFDNHFQFFASHVHIFKDKDVKILLCILQVIWHVQFNFHSKIPTPWLLLIRFYFRPFPHLFYKRFFFPLKLKIIFRIIKIKSLKWGHNFLLQHETRKMSAVVTVVPQIRTFWLVINLHPKLITWFQVQRRLESQRTWLTRGVCLWNITQPDSIPIQIKKNS